MISNAAQNSISSKTVLHRTAGRRRAQQPRQQQPQKKRSNYPKILMLLLCTAALVFFFFVFIRQMSVKIALKEELQATDQNLYELQHRRAGLEEELKQAQSPEYVEQQARSELRMVRKGEVLYVIGSSDAKPDSSAAQENKGSVKP